MTHIDKVLVLNEGRIELFGDRNSVLAQIQRTAIQPSDKKQVRAINP
jgi:ABC-type protease/lipase transport system fused ATPase/permease subunit